MKTKSSQDLKKHVTLWRALPYTMPIAILATLAVSYSTSAEALSCGESDGQECHGKVQQYAGGFKPDAGYGGFGGGNCVAHHTPVIFIHGNADTAISWDVPPARVPGYKRAPYSVYDTFKQRGYNDCELFGAVSVKEVGT